MYATQCCEDGRLPREMDRCGAHVVAVWLLTVRCVLHWTYTGAQQTDSLIGSDLSCVCLVACTECFSVQLPVCIYISLLTECVHAAVVIYSVQLQNDCSEDSDPTQWVAAACNVTSASATQVASVVDANIDVQIISSACAVTDVKTFYTSDALYTYASSLVVGSTATCYSYGDCLSSSGCSSCDGKMISIGGESHSALGVSH